MGQEVLLQMTDICKEFPGVKALDHVSLTVKKGTVHALMGENGAGKSTLMNMYQQKEFMAKTSINVRANWKARKSISKIPEKH